MSDPWGVAEQAMAVTVHNFLCDWFVGTEGCGPESTIYKNGPAKLPCTREQLMRAFGN